MPARLTQITPDDIPAIIKRLDGRIEPEPEVESRVVAILDNVAKRGDEALADYTRRFDCPDFEPGQLRVPAQALKQAAASIPDEDAEAIAEAAANVRSFHQLQQERSWWRTDPDGTVLGQLVMPVDRAGLYVPGGQGGSTPLISSLIMNAIPAQVAGVQSLAVVSPPREDGTLNSHLLATAHSLGITEVFACGGPWAIAALGHGTQSIAPADVIAGPGNIYVTTAKKLLLGRVGIDMLAGPSEILILADGSADARFVAADMLSQAEHDPQAAAILVTTSEPLAKAVQIELKAQVATLPRADIARQALADWGEILVVSDMDTALDVSNQLAPEHLELMVEDPWSLVGRIRHAGAIFMGHHCPEAAGDYFAGPNHVLPTMRTARFSSALSVSTFLKKSSLVATSCAFSQAHAHKIARLARLEGLEAHARSAELRANPNKSE